MEKFICQYQCNFGEEALFHIVKKWNMHKTELIAGGVTNAGFFEEYSWECDNDFTFEENLNDFIEYINEEEERRI